MKMWEIRENMGPKRYGYDEYEEGYEAGYAAAMKKVSGSKRMDDDDDEEEYPRHSRRDKMYR